MTRGLWEAKGTDDGLDRESQSKSNRGYPRDYIVFEHSKPVVLFQNCTEAMRVGMVRPGKLRRLIQRVLDDQLLEIEEVWYAR